MDDRYDPSALNVLGDCRERSDKFAEAQAALEKALTLGRSKGYTAQESGIADILCKIYGLAILRAASGDHLDEAAAIASKLDDLVRCYKEVEGFQSQEHGSALLMANATIDAMNAEQQCDYEKALDLYDRLLESPYIKCSESGTTLRWLVGTAYMRIGRILFLYQSHVADAIPYLQNAVQYCVPEDKQLHEARSLLKDAMSQA
jgi:tetratricopeptide (TPR) repeat protein